MLVAGTDARHLLGVDGGGGRLRPQATGPDYAADPYVGQAAQCGVEQVVVVATPDTAGQLSSARIDPATARVSTTEAPVPFRADGVAVFRRDTDLVKLDLTRGGRTTYFTWLNDPQDPNGPSTPPGNPELGTALAAAPGDGNAATAVKILIAQPDIVRFRQSDVRVLWSGAAGAGRTAAIATTALPGGARYLWGAIGSDGRDPGVYDAAFGGFVPAGAVDRTALTWQVPKGGPLVVVVPGTARVEIAGAGRIVTGGTLAPPGSAVRVIDSAGAEIPVLNVDTLVKVTW